MARGYLRQAGGLFLPDDGTAAVSDAALRAKATTPGQEVTYTCVPPGSGDRVALDRDEDELLNGVETNTGTFIDAFETGTDPTLADTDGDGFDDGLEVQFGSDPNNSNSVPNLRVPASSPMGLALLIGAVLWAGARCLGRGRRMRKPVHASSQPTALATVAALRRYSPAKLV